jgi:MFS family permease
MPDWPGWNGCRALVTTSAPAVRRRDALGAQTGAQALGLALGPTAGGILVSTVGWRWVFFINVPVGLVALVAGYYLLPRTRQRSPMATVDLVSVGLLAVASTGLLLGMPAASGLSIPGLGILGSLLLAALAGWAFRDRQRRLVGRPETRRRRPAGHNRWSHYLFARRVASVQFAGAPRADPLINPGLCRDPVVSWGLVGALCGYFILFGPLVLVPMALEGRGVSVLASGLTLAALPAGFALAAVVGAAGLPHALDERRALLAVAASWMGPRPG